ncbi:protein of unknown function (DUF1793) [Chthonomonas calidirosea]|uniref:Glutaminase n=1 Tax=Chthonomonas calidirosea (strain DSM 23976 / ICMP 18418 / T49) TaxID=1303518 RepID=S0EYJ3_CHTCT|nr:glutaminase family protein [Chthonomonas calidirosea]CCW35438.1 Domain of unknown function (DUF1793) [Chthonomonas calidirosea T49]CEK20277.1 protein of unknown function (DUF1793) [Chthonomonas calidirosea]
MTFFTHFAHSLLPLLFLLPSAAVAAQVVETAHYRPPAVPLVVHDPYFSVWSMSDHLTDDWTRHWTGAVNAMCGLIRIDGKVYRWAGPQPNLPQTPQEVGLVLPSGAHLPTEIPPMEQKGLTITPTHTTYRFLANGVELEVEFFNPLLPNEPDVLARPLTYLTLRVRSTDHRQHEVSLYYDCSAEWAVNTPDQLVVGQVESLKGLSVGRFGTEAQPILGAAGDNRRIDWGYFYLAAASKGQVHLLSDQVARGAFAAGGLLSEQPPITQWPRAANDHWPVLAVTFPTFPVADSPVTHQLLLAYDERYSIELMGQRLRPYWRRNGATISQLLPTALADYAALEKRCRLFDQQFMEDMRHVGGQPYERLMTLAYPQCLAAHGYAAGPEGQLLLFPKENFSNGCISTVDVIYPSAPLFLLLNTNLLKALLTPVMDYAASPRWKFPFAPHDLGTYPLANGQVYGGGEKSEVDQMPVEESGNLLILMAAEASIDGNAHFAERYWPELEKWANYLRQNGLDPANQLCTDDFAGHLAHNCNLSIKAIVALGCFAKLCQMTGRTEQAQEYAQLAHSMAQQWMKMADDGDHYRLAFDKPGTWSQKYNLVWDKILHLNLFPESVARKEVAFYLTKMNPYGLPLDNRATYTKLDWEVWTATLAESRADFDVFMRHIEAFMNNTPNRVPLTDWYDTITAKQMGFQARSVVGGIAIKLLADPTLWHKWAQRAQEAEAQTSPSVGER